MRVCFLSSMHPPGDKRVFDKEAIVLAAKGYDVVHLCPGEKSDSGMSCDIKIITYAKPAGIRGRLMQIFDLYLYAREIDADVYHCNEVDSWFVGVLLKIFRKKKCIFDVHEHYPSTFAESRFPEKVQPLVASAVRLVFRLLTPFTDRLVLAKKTVAADFPKAEHKTILVRNFTPLSGINFAGQRTPAQSGETIKLIHLGLFNKNRGWPQVLKALDLMENKLVFLEVIGEFNDGTRAEFDAAVRQYGLEHRIAVHDWMPFDQAFQYLANAHVGLVVFQPGILNHVYAMPHKMFDYMAAGMAVVCPDFAVEVAPVVQETGCGVLVDPADPVDLAKKLDALVGSPETIHAMGLRGQQAVRDHYNWEAEAARLLKMYQELDV